MPADPLIRTTIGPVSRPPGPARQTREVRRPGEWTFSLTGRPGLLRRRAGIDPPTRNRHRPILPARQPHHDDIGSVRSTSWRCQTRLHRSRSRFSSLNRRKDIPSQEVRWRERGGRKAVHSGILLKSEWRGFFQGSYCCSSPFPADTSLCPGAWVISL